MQVKYHIQKKEDHLILDQLMCAKELVIMLIRKIKKHRTNIKY